MHLPLKVVLALLALSMMPAVRAQTVVRTIPSHPLGERTVEVETGAIQTRDESDLASNSSVSVNLPVLRHLDVGLTYSYLHFNTSFGSGRDIEGTEKSHAWFATTTGYLSFKGLKPYLTAGVGYERKNWVVSYVGYPILEDTGREFTWALAAGVEIPVARVTLTPRITYQDYLNSRYSRDIRYGGFSFGSEARIWITKSIGGFVDASYYESQKPGYFFYWDRVGSWNWALGARYRF